MDLTSTELSFSNARKPELVPLFVQALADAGAMHLRIPQLVALQLQLDVLEKREVTLADGSKLAVPYVGPIHLRFGNRSGFMGAMVLGDEVLLGAIPMEDLDLVVHPATRTVTVHPLNPNFPASVAKGFTTRQND